MAQQRKVRVRFLTSAVTGYGYEYRRGEVHEVGEKFAMEMIGAGYAEYAEPAAATATRSERRKAVANAGGEQA